MTNLFASHKPSDEQSTKLNSISTKAQELVRVLEVSTVQSREQSLAITKLEEAVMWAKKAVFVQDQLPEDPIVQKTVEEPEEVVGDKVEDKVEDKPKQSFSRFGGNR